jgi:O-antigen/teichoic acid export membrane protein
MLSELICTIGDMGFGLAMQRRLPALLESSAEDARGMIGTYLLFCVVTMIVGGLLVYGLADRIGSGFLKESGDGLLVILSIPAVLSQVWRNQLFVLMQGTQSFGRYSILSLTFQTSWVGCSIGSYFIWGFKGFLAGLAVGSAIPCIYETWKMRQYLVMPPRLDQFMRFVRLALTYYPERFVNFAYTYADQWVVGYLLKDQQALATYFVPRRFFEQLLALLEGFWSVPTNVLSRESARGSDAFARSLAGFKRIFIYVFAPLSAGLFVSSWYVVHILAGPQYQDAVACFAILSVFFLVTGVFAPQMISIMVLAKPSERVKSLVLQNLTFIVTLPILAKLIGLEGVVIARVIASLAMAWISCLLVKKIVTTARDFSAVRAVLLPSLVLMAVGGLPQIFYYNRFVVPFYLAAAAIAYIWLFMRFVREDDVELLEHVLPRRLAWVGAIGRWCRPPRTTS